MRSQPFRHICVETFGVRTEAPCSGAPKESGRMLEEAFGRMSENYVVWSVAKKKPMRRH